MDLAKLKAPRPTQTTISLSPLSLDDEINVTYDRNAFSSSRPATAIARLASVLLEWDVCKDGKPFQPKSLSDYEHWSELIKGARKIMLERHERRIEDAKASGLDTGLLEAQKPIDPEAIVTAEEVRRAFSATFYDILSQLPVEFVELVDKAVNDDFLGEN